MDKNNLVVKSNALIQTSYRLTANEQKIILACISQVRRDEPITDQVMYTISASDFSGIYGTNLAPTYRDLKTAALKLKRREVRITQETNGKGRRKETLITSWVQSIKYSEGSGEVKLRFNHDILPYLAELNECFTSYSLSNIVKMSSTYGVRIYEILMQWMAAGEREVSIEWLKDILLLQDKYKTMCNFKARVLDPAIKDINKNSDIQVTFTQRKTGRKVTHLRFKFSLKENKTTSKKTEQRIFGVAKSVIEKQARPGETYEQAASRVKKINSKDIA